jgi:ureidoglycolate hydrolase
MTASTTLKQIKLELITPENFQPYGQVIFPSHDGKAFDETDAQLNLQNGIPRFYIMRLEKRGRKFHNIARHVQCTQCLGALEGKDWFMAVCPPNNDSDKPNLDELATFHIPGNCFIKLNEGTWHAGPYFDHDFVNFYNLELSNTNIVDFGSYDFRKNHQLEFEMVRV